MAPTEHVDVLIIGAGVSGIGAACHLTRACPQKSYVILERRHAIGGTWDLFRYPGVRSDSDMLTFGYNFRPWVDTKVLADGPAIRAYVEDTADEYGVRPHIHFGIGVTVASWSSSTARWTVQATDDSGEDRTYSCRFLIGATGYYNYEAGYRPTFAAEERFSGQIVHPQHWPEGLDYRGKKVVVIGSGATAITLVPAMSQQAAHVTMLQRSPSYVISLPANDAIAQRLARVLPEIVVYRLARARNIVIQRAIYAMAKARPNLVRRLIMRGARKQLGPSADLRSFTPTYDPWSQRLCIVPDGDLFRVVRKGRATIVTDEIDAFTETGIRLRSGDEIDADLVIVATGLQVQMLGGAHLVVDDAAVELNSRMTYKGVLIEGVPNAAIVFGYTNASWTLKADIACEYACRLINYLDHHGYDQAVATADGSERTSDSVMAGLSSGYVQRGNSVLPRQGTRSPWRVRNDYLRDAPQLRRGAIDDGILQFASIPQPRRSRIRSTTVVNPAD